MHTSIYRMFVCVTLLFYGYITPAANNHRPVMELGSDAWTELYAGLKNLNAGLFDPYFSRRAYQIGVLSDLAERFTMKSTSFSMHLAELCMAVSNDIAKASDSDSLASLEKEFTHIVEFSSYMTETLPSKITQLSKDARLSARDEINRATGPILQQALREKRLLETEELHQIITEVDKLLEKLAHRYKS